MDLTIHAINQRLKNYDTLSQILTFRHITDLLAHAAPIKRDLNLVQPAAIASDARPPDVLSPSVRKFLQRVLQMEGDLVDQCWEVFKDLVWIEPSMEQRAQQLEDSFAAHGHEYGITLRTFFPPNSTCNNPDCSNSTPLMKHESRSVVAYTEAYGPRPAWSVHRYCERCHTNYQHNFAVRNGERLYYGGVPQFIQIGEHQFIETTVISGWANLMVTAWVSATNCANAYNLSPHFHDLKADRWQFGSRLATEHVWDGFVLMTLLEDYGRRHERLRVPHTGEQRRRFDAAMQERNNRIILQGQPELRHYCDKCMRLYNNDDGTKRRVQAVVVDGITMGHPCCGHFRCTEPLQSNRHRFCATHQRLHNVCAIVECSNPIRSGHKTCSRPEHIEMERLHMERGAAMFQLKQRLQRAQVAHPNNALVSSTEDDVEDMDESEEWFEREGQSVRLFSAPPPGSIGELDCPAKAPEGNIKIKAKFGRSRTHNEEIIVRPCGVIVARATFFGAEAVSNVLIMIKRAFSIPGAIKPDHVLYDSNCNALRELRGRNCDRALSAWFADVGMAVDVFHHKSKHKEQDTLCATDCNPANFPELMDNNKWYFNSSVAEQTNVWLGGFHSICREMLPLKYNFFLDEMIIRRNRTIVDGLRRSGQHPNRVPFDP